MHSRDGSDERMPSWPMAMPSVTVMVQNSRGVPPPAATPFFTTCAWRISEMLQGAASFQQLASLGQVTGPQRAPAQPRQRVGGLRPQAKVLGHAQTVPVHPVCLRAVPGCGRCGTKPLDGLQLPPAVTELTE